MNVPLSWLSEYVELPKSEKELTDRLTMVGHMLDKRKEVGNDVVIDLELRGNRADMFGMIGVARDIATIFNTPLRWPNVSPLPKTNAAMPLLKAERSVKGLVKRYMAIKMEVTIKASPKWLADRLSAYGIEPYNNVIDVTNYVMVETSHPMHAFDADKLTGDTLILRKAKQGEKFETIQQGTTLTLTTDDIAIADAKGVQSLTCIGGAKTKVTDTTKTILLETAVYDSASCRRTGRRHKIATEGGGRHEKHQDPHELPFTLARAIEILKEIAGAKIIGEVSDYYPEPVKQTKIDFNPSEVARLAGIHIPTNEITRILSSLGCEVVPNKKNISVTIPTFRTDISQSADLVEEIVRVHGYDKVPVETMIGQLPKSGTPPHIRFQHTVKYALAQLQMNEIITSTLMAKADVAVYERHGAFTPTITLVNAPDPHTATLRPSLLPNLVEYAKRSLGFRQKRIALFEIGNVYAQPKPNVYKEHAALGIIMGGETPGSWNKKPHTLSFFDLKGIIESLAEMLGISIELNQSDDHPSMSVPQGKLMVKNQRVGHIGLLDQTIRQSLGVKEVLHCAELDLDMLRTVETAMVQPYTIAPLYPPVFEDISFVMPEASAVGPLLTKIQRFDPLVASATLTSIYEQTRTIHITYQDPTKNLTGQDILPIHAKIIAMAKKEFGAVQKSA